MSAAQKTDLVIIGAGIHGAAIAREACRDGHRVTLIEQFDKPAQGTSSRSSKLIHGGLRYLESFEFKLVRECLADRKRLVELYPDLVKLQPFYIPVYKNFKRSRLIIRAGLMLYAVLGGLHKATRFRKLKAIEWRTLDGLSSDQLLDVFQYYDAQTDDFALTTRLLDEAVNDGLDLNYGTSFQACEYNDNSVNISILKQETRYEILAKFLINASGPWVNQVVEKCTPAIEKFDIDLVQGAHIEIPGQLQQGIYYLEAPQDQRAVFAMPWKDHILVGTTETVFEGDPGDCVPTEEEMTYLLEVYNNYFVRHVSKKDIINSWAGLRVLPRDNKNPFKRSRETLLIPDKKNNPRVISIYGGKLTSHYSTALKLLRMLK